MNNPRTSTCYYCCRFYGQSIRGGKPLLRTKDHIIPVSKGGINNPRNILYCCMKCNGFKGDRTPDEFANAIRVLAEKKVNKWGAEYCKTVLANLESLILTIALYRHTLYKKGIEPPPIAPQKDRSKVSKKGNIRPQKLPPDKLLPFLSEDWQERFNANAKK